MDWLVGNLRPAFLLARWPVSKVLDALETGFQGFPPLLFIILVGVLTWKVSSWRLSLGATLSLLLIGFVGLWAPMMTTVAMVSTSVVFCTVVGVPLGIWAARHDRVWLFMRPILDAMQTTPTFVYLVPIIMLFGIGNVPAVMATIIAAMPPIVRLTNLGIRQVKEELVEAGEAFGCTPFQLLREVQIPLATPTIMAGLNQCLMLSLSMVVIAALIGAKGLGLTVYQGINRLDMGLSGVAGISIVLLAIVLDRTTQAIAKQK